MLGNNSPSVNILRFDKLKYAHKSSVIQDGTPGFASKLNGILSSKI